MSQTQRTLAIDPGTRYWGYAIFKGQNLYDLGVKNFKTNGTDRQRIKEAKKVFSCLVEDFAPDILVIEKPFFFWSKQSNLLNTIIEEIKAIAKKEKIKVHELSPRTVRKIVCGNGNATKADMAKVLAMRFPELSVRLNQDRKYKERYWGHSFDAVGLGVGWINKKSVKWSYKYLLTP